MTKELNIDLSGVEIDLPSDQMNIFSSPVEPEQEVSPIDPPETIEDTEPSTEGEQEIETEIPSTEGDKERRPHMGKGEGDLRNPLNWANYPSAVGAGLIDTAIDTVNWAIPGKIPDIPKLPTYESTSLQAWREISSLVLPYLILKGKAIGGATTVHKAKVAPQILQKLGNNPLFQRFAKVGLDLGVGATVDSIAKTNEVNDTLATSWKRGQWWGHAMIPEAWTSDKLGPDGKKRANVLEGMRLGFYTDVAFGFAKLAKAGRSTQKVTELLAESTSQKNLDALYKDPLDSTVFDPDNPVLDSIARSEAKHSREINKLKEYYEGKELNRETVGVDSFANELENGILTQNGSILEAAVDQTRIVNNRGTSNGRLANVLTDAFRKAGSEVNVATERTVLKALRKDLLDGGQYSAKLPDGKKLPWKEIDREATILAEVIADPTLPRGDLVKILDNFKVLKNELKQLDPVGYKAVNKATSKYLDFWSDISTHKARGLMLTSEAGQVSDLAEGARIMDGTDAIPRAQEQILDRLEFFDIESSIADFEWKAKARNFEALKAAVESKDSQKLIRQLEEANQQYDDKLSDIIIKSKQFRETLQSIYDNNPEFAKSLTLAYEVANGDAKSIKGLNHMIKNNFGVFNKSIIDGDPELPSMLNKALMSNIFNSMLSALATPFRAVFGNLGGLISEPVSVFYGALREGDGIQMKRAAHMYFGFSDTAQKGFKYMGEIFKKASESPENIAHVFRQDLALEEAVNAEFAESIATAAAKNGEYGPQVILNYTNELKALARHPALRFGPNAMTALDGFTEATQKIAQDKGMAFDILMEKYPGGPSNWTQKEFKEVYDNLWKQGWDDSTGTISQSAVEYSKREIALNLDTPLVRRLNPLIKKFPLLRSIFWFPTTQMNALDMFGKYGNTSRVAIGTNFAGEYAELLGPLGTKKIEDFTIPEIKNILSKRGMDMSGDYMAKFKHLRYKTRGRVATGNLAVMGAGMLFMQGRIRGNGHWDATTQKQRLNKGWRPLTWKPPGLDKWISYEWLGPLAKWVGLTVDGFDNFNSMSTTRLDQFGKKMGFILGASITNDSIFGSMEPLFSLLGNNDAARNRYIGNMTNAIFPLSGFRNELGKNMYGMLREVESDDIGQIMRNRNNYLDLVDPEGALPSLVDWTTGKPIKKSEGNIWQRSFQNTTGIYSYNDPSENSQFLIDIEYDSSPHFSVSPGGVEYTSRQRNELYSLIGQDGGFASRLTTLRKRAENLTYKTEDGKIIKGYVNIMHYARNRGITGAEMDDYKNIKFEIDRALRSAKNRVIKQLSDRDEINQQERINYRKGKRAEQGEIEEILDLINQSPIPGSN